MIEYGFIYKCVDCGCGDIWNHKNITLEIDHMNENGLDNRPENLQFLCPNCHSQKTILKLCKRVTKEQYNEAYRAKMLKRYEDKINLVLTSDIDFKTNGSMKRLACLINVPTQYISRWLKKWMPEFYKQKFIN